MLETRGAPPNVVGKLFVVFLIALLAFQHHLLKMRVPSLGCTWLAIVRYEGNFFRYASLEKILAGENHPKPTFTDQYLRWESFSALKRKISLISTLVHRAPMICTKRKLNGEIERIKKILLDNGYPKNIINTQITKKIAQFSTLKRFGPEKCSVYLRVAWIGKPSANLKKEVKTAVESCYGSVSIRLIFTSKRMLPVAHKDVLFTIQKSSVIYKYKCHCDSRYVRRTSQRLQDRIKQHVPQWLRQQ